MLAPALGLWARWYAARGEIGIFKITAAMALSILLLPDLVAVVCGKDNGNLFANFWNPLVTIGFLGILFRQIKVSYTEHLENDLSIGALTE